jgi:TfoX/Sxy family transcriptional regulator of competence genes
VRARTFVDVAYDELLAERLRRRLVDEPVAEKKMFGGLAFLLAGNMAVAASGHGGLLARVDPSDSDDLLAEPGAEAMDMGRGPMRGWLRVSPDVLDDDAVLDSWVRRSLAYAKSLPPK